jgi:hypothetical protein
MLASHVLRVLRLPEGGRYSSERELRQWLVDEEFAEKWGKPYPAIKRLAAAGERTEAEARAWSAESGEALPGDQGAVETA